MSKVFCKDLFGKGCEVSAGELSFRPAVYGIIIENDRILLSKEWDGYSLPGGGVDLGETVEEALKREVKEETGLEIQVGAVIACETSFFKLPDADDCVQSILLYYICNVTGGELSKEFLDEKEKDFVDMPEWVDLNKIKEVKFYSTVDCLKIIGSALKLR